MGTREDMEGNTQKHGVGALAGWGLGQGAPRTCVPSPPPPPPPDVTIPIVVPTAASHLDLVTGPPGPGGAPATPQHHQGAQRHHPPRADSGFGAPRDPHPTLAPPHQVHRHVIGLGDECVTAGTAHGDIWGGGGNRTFWGHRSVPEVYRMCRVCPPHSPVLEVSFWGVPGAGTWRCHPWCP